MYNCFMLLIKLTNCFYLHRDDVLLERITGQIILIICAVVVCIFVVANMYSISRVVQSLVFSQRRQLQRAISRLDTLKSEGFLQALRCEVNLMTEMVSFIYILLLLLCINDIVVTK